MTWPSPFAIPTPAELLASARAMLSPRARAGLDALPDPERRIVAHDVCARGEHGLSTSDTDARLSRGQPWPDVIEYDPKEK